LDFDFTPGTHIFKFVVDGHWLCSDEYEKTFSGSENDVENNVIRIK
jgi:hypothetical protein